MLKKPQILNILFLSLIFFLILAYTNCAFEVEEVSESSKSESKWETSAHADATAEAFTHWDEDTPPEVSTSCAKCHSTPGFIDFIADGSVDSAAPIGTTVECEVCHTDIETGALRVHTSVTFPSDILVEDLGPEALCMECHQGRSSGPDVDEEITDAAVADDDTISSSIGFKNVHYKAAAAVQFGTITKGGYEYSGNGYDARFAHVEGYNACKTCHDPHSLEVKIDDCNTCHTGITDPKNIRYYGSFTDYDGDGNTTEGIYYEIPDFQTKLYAAILAYGTQVGAPVAYDSHTYPYFFNDTNGNGEVDSSEANYGNGYRSFTGRLLKACYNYQFSLKDHGAYAHGGKYVIQLLYDSIEDLNTYLNNPVSLEGMHRGDEGHFDGSAEAWRHWDGDGEVSSSCAKCHSAEGLPYLIENGENIAAEISNGLLCTTCHTSPPAVRTVGAVTFPSGVSKDMGDSSNLCLNCHQGRASKLSVDNAIAASPGPYRFINIHYFPAAVVLLGSETHGGYEFTNKIYVGQKTFANHNGRFDTCIECHMGTQSPRKTDEQSSTYGDHNVHKPNPEDCVFCHGQDVSQPNQGVDPSKFEFSGIRPASIPDYDGDGNVSESTQNEIKGLEEALYAQIQAYAENILGMPVVYEGHTYPYLFNDTNANGEVDPGEAIYPNSYTSLDAALLKAVYNYQLSKKEPCGHIHNSRYIAQLLVDSIEHLGGNISEYAWR
ncbi:hypothetical protein LCGC14_1643500 [marine sediment metagenome]|uniref:Uncharacterized protein n=1 Tax=marine sediment metagenome TaxID=412755 RepID=A0A0F9KYR9_9ZZZZ